MQKVDKTKGKNVKSVTSGCLTVKANKAKNGKASKVLSPLPFAHRTPTQLHASTYAIKRG